MCLLVSATVLWHYLLPGDSPVQTAEHSEGPKETHLSVKPAIDLPPPPASGVDSQDSGSYIPALVVRKAPNSHTNAALKALPVISHKTSKGSNIPNEKNVEVEGSSVPIWKQQMLQRRKQAAKAYFKLTVLILLLSSAMQFVTVNS